MNYCPNFRLHGVKQQDGDILTHLDPFLSKIVKFVSFLAHGNRF